MMIDPAVEFLVGTAALAEANPRPSSVFVPVVIELGADDKPVPEQDGRDLSIRTSLTALEEEPVPLHPDGWTTGGGYRSLACMASFRAVGHEHASLRLDVTVPLLEQPVSYVFTLDQR
jgi:hypothetical protein